MSLTPSYNAFEQQLRLKLTLGQQFKQVIQLPEALKKYVPEQIESSQDLLQLNQYWVLMKQAGHQAMPISDAIEKSLAAEKPQLEIQENALDASLLQVLQWIVAQEAPYDYALWLDQILKWARQQQQVIPRYLVLPVLSVCRNSVLLAQTLPQFAFQGDVTTRIDEVKRVWKYLKHNDAAPLIRHLLKLRSSDWSRMMSLLCTHLPDFVNQHIAEFWTQSIQKNSLQRHAERVVSMHMPVTKFPHLYQCVKSLAPQNAATVRQNAALSFYLYAQDNALYPDMMALIDSCFSYEATTRKINVHISLDQDDALNDYGFFHGDADVEESRRILKTAYQSAQVEQAYQAFMQSGHGIRYVQQILKQLPLQYWFTLLGDWDTLLNLHKSQKEAILAAFIDCCYREQRGDLARWFYQQQGQWCDTHIACKQHGQYVQQIFSLLNQDEIGLALIRQQLQHHAQSKDWLHFECVWQLSPVLHFDQVLTTHAYALLQQAYAALNLQQDQKQFAALKAQAEWLILHGYPIHIQALQGLFSTSEWKQLERLNQYKHTLI